MIKRCSTRGCNKEAVRVYGGHPRCAACVRRIRENHKLWMAKNRPKKHEFSREYYDRYHAKPKPIPLAKSSKPREYKAHDIQWSTPEKVAGIINQILANRLTYVHEKSRHTPQPQNAISAPTTYNTKRRIALRAQGAFL